MINVKAQIKKHRSELIAAGVAATAVYLIMRNRQCNDLWYGWTKDGELLVKHCGNVYDTPKAP